MSDQHPAAPPPLQIPVYPSAAASLAATRRGVVDVAGDLVGALTGTPVVLALLIVNCVFAGSAAWFLGNQEESRHKERMQLIDRCIPPRPVER